mmetsp:Transcript_47716/g.110594  ORF Transcript_47716/g.110594 Transcript_47716/m.110594 type:complete len:295 (-) Transcript_47716:34-918(-)
MHPPIAEHGPGGPPPVVVLALQRLSGPAVHGQAAALHCVPGRAAERCCVRSRGSLVLLPAASAGRAMARPAIEALFAVRFGWSRARLAGADHPDHRGRCVRRDQAAPIQRQPALQPWSQHFLGRVQQSAGARERVHLHAGPAPPLLPEGQVGRAARREHPAQGVGEAALRRAGWLAVAVAALSAAGTSARRARSDAGHGRVPHLPRDHSLPRKHRPRHAAHRAAALCRRGCRWQRRRRRCRRGRSSSRRRQRRHRCERWRRGEATHLVGRRRLPVGRRFCVGAHRLLRPSELRR